MARSELDAWRAEHPHAKARPEDFAAIRAGLRDVKLAEIMTTLGVSKASASSWRSGRIVPALRHWPALATLAGVEVPPGILDEPRGARVLTFEREADLREQALDDWEHEQAAAMVATETVEQHPVSALAVAR